jgi:hypothetical protein
MEERVWMVFFNGKHINDNEVNTTQQIIGVFTSYNKAKKFKEEAEEKIGRHMQYYNEVEYTISSMGLNPTMK